MIYRMLIVMLIGLFVSCGHADPINNEDPRDLSLEVGIAEDASGLVSIEANAFNATSYSLYIDSEDDPVEENQSGRFEYSFVRSGVHQLTVRAYGLSGSCQGS